MKQGVNVTSAAEMRSPGAEGRPFSGECYFRIVYYIASPPEHLVLVGDWEYWDRCTAGPLHSQGKLLTSACVL